VNYQNDAETFEFASTLAALPGYNGDVYVVSNSPSTQLDGLLALNNARSDQSRLFLIFPESNLGYFGGAARALNIYLTENSLPEWTMVSNTDVVFSDQDLFNKLATEYPSGPPAVVAPDIVLQSRSGLPSSLTHQNPHMESRPAALRLRFLHLMSRWYPIYAGYELLSTARYALGRTLGIGSGAAADGLAKARSIYAPFGACMFFHRSYFESGCGLDYPSFLFGEEIFVAESARARQLRVEFNPRLRVVHREHGSIRLVPSRRIARYQRDSHEFLLKAYFQ
jgi:GT2 family glycosyltransferase